jgi:hypothetical protein
MGTRDYEATGTVTKFPAASARARDPTVSRLAVKFLRISAVVDNGGKISPVRPQTAPNLRHAIVLATNLAKVAF